MHRSILVTLLFGIFALSGCSGKKEAEVEKENKAALFNSGKQNDLDLSYIPGDALVVAVINPQRMLKAPLFAKISDKELAALAGEGNKFDVRQLKQIVAYSGMPNIAGPSEGGSPGGAILRFSTAQDPAQLAQQMFGIPESQNIEGVSAFVGAGGESALAAVDDKTFLVGPLSQLSKMLKAKNSNGPAIDKLRTAPTDNDIVGVFVMNEDLRAMAGFMLGMASQGDGVPAELKDAAKIPANLQSATFIVDFSKKSQFFNLAVEMKDTASAATLQKLADKGMELAKSQLAADFERMSQGAPAELADKTKTISQQLMNSIEVTQEDSLVIATADMPDDVDDVMVKAIVAARNAAELSKRKNDLKQVAIGLLNYHDTYKNFPPAPGNAPAFDENGKPHLSWRVHILPFMEEQNLYEQFHLDEPWDSEHNKTLLSQIPEIFKSKATDPTLTTMLMVTGKGLAYEGGAGERMASFTDGTSNTVIVVDAGADRAVPWTKPVDMTIDPENPVLALGQAGESGYLALRVDGSVFTIPENISATTLWALFTRGGDDIDQADEF